MALNCRAASRQVPKAGNIVGALYHNCNTQSSAPEHWQNNFPKHVELTGIINKPLLFHLVGCLYYLYQWCTVKQISDNEIYLLIKYLKSVLCRAAKRLSYTEEARCLKVKEMKRYWNFKERAQNGAMWKTRFGRKYDPVVRQTAW